MQTEPNEQVLSIHKSMWGIFSQSLTPQQEAHNAIVLEASRSRQNLETSFERMNNT